MAEKVLAGEVQVNMSFSIRLSSDLRGNWDQGILPHIIDRAFESVRPHLSRNPRDFQWQVNHNVGRSDPFDMLITIACRFTVDDIVQMPNGD